MANSGKTATTLLLIWIGVVAIALIQPIAGSRWDDNNAAQGNMIGNLTEMKPFMGKCPVNNTCMVMDPKFAFCPANDECLRYNCQTFEGACLGTNKTTGKTCFKVAPAKNASSTTAK